MMNGITWEEQTHSRFEQARKEQQKEQNLAESHINNAKRWEEIADALERVLRLIPSQNIGSDSGRDLDNKEQLLQHSTWDNLNAIMNAKNGLLVVNEAVDFLVHMKVFANRKHARNVIYSTLYSHKKDITKIREGIYHRKERTIGKDAMQIELIKLKNPMSFGKGVMKVLNEAQGEPLHSNNVWQRMQKLGIMSNARDPAGWVDRIAKQNGAIKVAPRTWLMKNTAPLNNIQPNSEQIITSIPSVNGIITPQ